MRQTRFQERGVVLLMVVFITVIVTAFGLLALSSGQKKAQESGQSDLASKAKYVADAGLDRARRYLYNCYTKASGFPTVNTVLTNSQNSGTTNLAIIKSACNWATLRANWTTYTTSQQNYIYGDAVTDVSFNTNWAFNGGAYYIYVANDNDGGGATNDTNSQVVVTVTATLDDGTQAQIQAMVYYNPAISNYTPVAAILANGSITMNGNVALNGTDGVADTNNNITISGANVSIAVSGNAAGTISPGQSPVPPGGFNSGVSPFTIPTVTPSQYFSDRTYDLTNGYVYDVSGNLLANLNTGGSSWNGITYNAGTYSVTGNSSTLPGAYYIDNGGNLKISGNGTAFSSTWIVTGNITASGNATMNSYMQNTLFIAGGTISLSGNAASNAYNGLVAATTDVTLSGNASVGGSVLSQTGNITNSLSGNASITYNGGMQTLLQVQGGGSVSIRNLRTTQ